MSPKTNTHPSVPAITGYSGSRINNTEKRRVQFENGASVKFSESYCGRIRIQWIDANNLYAGHIDTHPGQYRDVQHAQHVFVEEFENIESRDELVAKFHPDFLAVFLDGDLDA